MTLLALLSAPALAQIPQPAHGRWAKKGSSLLYYDASGSPAAEIGLGRWDDAAGARETRGGVSRSGRFAWTLELSQARRRLRFLGTSGEELWGSPDGGAPEASEPVIFSRDEERVAVALRGGDGWRIVVRTYLGKKLAEAGPFPRLEEIALTSNGRFALARWSVLDQSATHTFLNVDGNARRDVPSVEFVLGKAVLTEDGRVLSGRKALLDLAAPAPPKKP